VPSTAYNQLRSLNLPKKFHEALGLVDADHPVDTEVIGELANAPVCSLGGILVLPPSARSLKTLVSRPLSVPPSNEHGMPKPAS
jgi:hypothetical protein